MSRYRRVDEDTALRIPASGGPPLSFADIKEASAKVSGAVLEAAIAETGPFLPVSKLYARQPGRRRCPARRARRPRGARLPQQVRCRAVGQCPSSLGGGCFPAAQCRRLLRHRLLLPAVYYAPFGYAYVGYYDPFLFPGYCCSYIGGGGGGGIIVDGGGDLQPSGRARAVNGLGYTRSKSGDPNQAVTRTPETSAVSISNSGSPRSTTS